MVYQAVAEYWVNAKEQEHEMDIEIQVPNRMIPIRINKKYTFWTTWVSINNGLFFLNNGYCF